nr:hypothetical protein [Tanacetum cinerariifolium]
MPRECLKIIESKSKVRQSRAKAVVAKKNQSSAPTPSTTHAPVKAVEPNCVTCGGAHSYQNCPATHENAYRDNIQEYVSQAAAANYNQGNTGFRPQMTADPPFSLDPKSSHDDISKPSSDDGKKVDEDPGKENESVNTTGINKNNELPFDQNLHALEDVSIFNFLNDNEDDGTVADINNLDTTIQVSPILTTRIHKDHPLNQMIRDLHSATQTRKMLNNLEEH